MAMKQYIEEFYNTEEQATKAGIQWEVYLGYTWTVEKFEDKWKLILKTDQVLMG